jgi:hypothetical protein
MSHDKTSVKWYATLFEGSGTRHSNSGLYITQDMYRNGFCMVLYDLTPDLAASEGHASAPTSGDIRIDLKFGTAIPEGITCLLYLECDNSIRIDLHGIVSTDYSLWTPSRFSTLHRILIIFSVFVFRISYRSRSCRLPRL